MREGYDLNYKYGVIVLAAGRGSRMNSDIPKQYMDIDGFPVLYYSLKVFNDYPAVKNIVIATSPDDVDMVKEDIVERYGIGKVTDVVAGGAERYDSVYNAMKHFSDIDYIMVHDGARPCINTDILDRLCESVVKDKASVPAVPSKDTVRLADREGYVTMTPDRSTVWNIQTPQVFEYEGIYKAYNDYYREVKTGNMTDVHITDDAMMWERFDDRKIRLVMGDYDNIKITTPGDMEFVRNTIDKAAYK